ncbi:glutaredoxin family protein [Shewanella intestini]|uniref:Glutaredoxin family protein n=1 Tax=Shewanella intestini TaxID=2017544 RepID=A0ABS5I0C3_9GAMM|nr:MULTISPECIES: glutaredoxin family protein [Shewanella]MBR9727483.1 glutaredoxin family protein [Shewanella intestini]MRG35467.1 glutaredoxin family protein [Shewanella sp. XMDDZSB0408]
MGNTDTTYVLFHTQGCHLCDIAQALIEQTGASYSLIDICDDPALAQQYGMTIPVFSNGQQALNWPFDLVQLHTFLGSKD